MPVPQKIRIAGHKRWLCSAILSLLAQHAALTEQDRIEGKLDAVMDITKPPRIFISYSHDSPEHEERVLALSDRLRHDGVDATLDQYESAPPEGWPGWMEHQIEDANFVLIVCSETYLRRVQGKEEPRKGQGVVWEINSIYNRLYSAKLANEKFIPVLLEGASSEDIPVPLGGFTHYRVSTEPATTDFTDASRTNRSQVSPLSANLEACLQKKRASIHCLACFHWSK